MLDQSFSAENFRNIFHIENRKGNLQKAMFPAQYIDLIKDIKSLKTEIKEISKERKDGTIFCMNRLKILVQMLIMITLDLL